MQLSVERIRWGLLAGALLLVTVLAALLSYGRYRAVQAWKQILKRSGATITHEANGVTYSQSLGGKQIFTLHAKREVPHGDGKYTLEDGMLQLYGPNGQPTDRIYGASFDYDQKQGIAHAAGEVDMEIEPPAALTGHASNAASANASAASKSAAAGQVIHVRTSGLTYVKKLGVAATDQDVEIEYGGMHGHARGAEFDSGQNLVHLLADVRVNGELRGSPALLTATKADLDRANNEIALDQPVIRSGARTGSAAHALLHLRNDGSLEALEANAAGPTLVTLREGFRIITARTLRAQMNERSEMKNAELAGHVSLTDTNPQRPITGTAQTVKIAFDDAGFARTAVLEGPATLAMQDRRPGLPVPLERTMGGDKVTLTLVRSHGTSRLTAVRAEGGAFAKGDSLVRASSTTDKKLPAVKKTSVRGDDLLLTLVEDAAGKQQPDHLTANGHTQIEQRMPDGSTDTSTGDALQASFAEQGSGLEIASAEQTGNVRIRSLPAKPGEQPGEGTAARASFDGATNVLTLTGRPRLTRGDMSVAAETIRLPQQTGDAFANGDVDATFASANAKPGARVTHVLAADAVLHRAAQTVEFHGTDDTPAKMWQGPSQIEAANLLLDRSRDSLQAWPQSPQGNVKSVFASAPSTASPASSQTARSQTDRRQTPRTAPTGERAVTVTSARLVYTGSSHQAVFTGGVIAQGQDGTVHAQRGVAFLQPKPNAPADATNSAPVAKAEPDPVASSIQKIVLSGAVRLDQPGRTATGEQLLYTASTGEYVLTGSPGHPPHVVDDKQGNISGATLLFRSPDSTIVVAGAGPGEPGSHRVHTETTVKK